MAVEKFARINVDENVKREIDIIAATNQKPVYKVVEEMLSIYKAATVETLPAPRSGKKVKLIKAARVR